MIFLSPPKAHPPQKLSRLAVSDYPQKDRNPEKREGRSRGARRAT